MELQLVSGQDAEASPVGKGHDEPDALPMPKSVLNNSKISFVNIQLTNNFINVNHIYALVAVNLLPIALGFWQLPSFLSKS